MTIELESVWETLFSNKPVNEQKYEQKEKEKCCKDEYLIEDEGYRVCTNCGITESNTVLDSNIFTFENGENNKHLRQFDNHLFPVSSTSTKISGNSRISKIQNWQSMPYNERVLWEISNELKAILHDQFSPRIINDALILYKKFYEVSGIHRGENKRGFIAVCVYISTSQNFANSTPKEISLLLDVDIKVMYRCIQKYSEIMKIPTNCNRTSVDFVDRFLTKMNINFKVRKPVVKILQYVEKYQTLGSYMPQNVCIGTIVFVCKEMKTELNIEIITKEFSISFTTIDKIISILTKDKKKMFKSIAS